jgi:hypothetical protein
MFYFFLFCALSFQTKMCAEVSDDNNIRHAQSNTDGCRSEEKDTK